jgi:hypothetical protein
MQVISLAARKDLLAVTENDGPRIYKADTCAVRMWDVCR